jgi:hypothetical protein
MMDMLEEIIRGLGGHGFKHVCLLNADRISGRFFDGHVGAPSF